jgi:hypothetical protein
LVTVALFPVASAEYDVELAEAEASEAISVLRAAGFSAERTTLLMDPAEAASAASHHGAADAAIVLFATFTDSTIPAAIASSAECDRIVLWAIPESRTGQRLRLHSLGGMNLAGYALTRAGIGYRWLYAGPGDQTISDRLHGAITGPQPFVPRSAKQREEDLPATALMRADELRRRLAATAIGVVGDHPVGFEPSAYDPGRLRDTTGISAEPIELDAVFRAGTAATHAAVEAVKERAERRLGSLSHLDAAAVAASIRLHCGLDTISRDRQWAGVAVRCWPECFTMFGGAACTALAMLTDDNVAAACEADVYGVVTSLLLQAVADEPAFVAELADLDVASNTGVFWHCGNAPPHMAGAVPAARGISHPSRQLPLAGEYSLKPGRVTIARLSQAGGEHQLVIGGGAVLEEPLPFAGTGGVVRLDHPVERVLETVMGRGLEHHYGLVYGDHHATLAAVACRWGVPILSL